uniref:Uncharacterized protein n=1 Tax=Brassica oleracea var. oleracea TaxID=109376 RepID=A0A0D3A1C3_BRAOL
MVKSLSYTCRRTTSGSNTEKLGLSHSLLLKKPFYFVISDSVEDLMEDTHELGGTTVAVDRASPKEDDPPVRDKVSLLRFRLGQER